MKLLVILFAFLSATALAQKVPKDFKEITMEEMNMTTCSFDTAASAMVLFNYGHTETDFYRGSKLTIHCRLKVLRKEGTNLLDIDEMVRGAKITRFDAVVYNLDERGAIVPTVLTEEDIILAREDRYKWKLSVAFPNIRTGAVIEFIIKAKYPLFTLPDWRFERNLPVLQSEYSMTCPDNQFCQAAVTGDASAVRFRTRRKGRYAWWGASELKGVRIEPLMPPFHWFVTGLCFDLPGGVNMANLFIQANGGLLREKDAWKTQVENTFTLGEHNQLTGSMTITRSGISAAEAREAYAIHSDLEYSRRVMENTNCLIESFEVLNVEDTLKPFVEKYQLQLDGLVTASDSVVILNPAITIDDFHEVFKNTTRTRPLYFGAYVEMTTVTTIHIPDGYKVLQLPESKISAMEDGSVKSTIQVSSYSNAIHITTRLFINRPIYRVEEYPALRDFFQKEINNASIPVLLSRG